MPKTVPLVTYHEDRRIVIGEAIVDENGLVKAHIFEDAEGIQEVVGTVFVFGPEKGKFSD